MKKENTKDGLADLVVAQTKKHWDEVHTPYLLSDVANFVIGEGYKYRELIYPHTLKQWLLTLGSKVKVVQHPNRKARVGIIPAGEIYAFEDEDEIQPKAQPKEEIVGKTYARSHKYVLMNFLQALSTLDKEDVEQVIIPTAVLAKLLREK